MHKISDRFSSKNQLNKILLFSFLYIAAFGIFESGHYSYAQTTNTTSQGNNVTTTSLEPQTPIEYIAKIRILLDQTITEYSDKNYTKAEEIATTAYLDNFEYVEKPLAEKDRPLMETTEIMMREELRKMITDHVSLDDLKEHIDKINDNLDKSVKALS